MSLSPLEVLILRRQPGIDVTDPLVLLSQLGAQRFRFGFDEIANRVTAPEFVASSVAAVIDAEHLFEDLQVVGDAEGVPRILVGEEVVEVVEPAQVMADRHSGHGSWVDRNIRSRVGGRSGIS